MRKHLRDLTKIVGEGLRAIDVEMEKHESPERGKRIAAITNAMEMANDRARYFGLGVDWRKDKK